MKRRRRHDHGQRALIERIDELEAVLTGLLIRLAEDHAARADELREGLARRPAATAADVVDAAWRHWRPTPT